MTISENKKFVYDFNEGNKDLKNLLANSNQFIEGSDVQVLKDFNDCLPSGD